MAYKIGDTVYYLETDTDGTPFCAIGKVSALDKDGSPSIAVTGQECGTKCTDNGKNYQNVCTNGKVKAIEVEAQSFTKNKMLIVVLAAILTIIGVYLFFIRKKPL